MLALRCKLQLSARVQGAAAQCADAAAAQKTALLPVANLATPTRGLGARKHRKARELAKVSARPTRPRIRLRAPHGHRGNAQAQAQARYVYTAEAQDHDSRKAAWATSKMHHGPQEMAGKRRVPPGGSVPVH